MKILFFLIIAILIVAGQQSCCKQSTDPDDGKGISMVFPQAWDTLKTDPDTTGGTP